MIKIFNATDRDFSSAGNITINPTKCIETRKKSLNGWYIDVEIPIKYKDDISPNMLCVVKTKSKLNPQAFRIKNIEYTSRKIVFQARHVMFDAEDFFLLDVRPENKNAQNALSYINERTDKTSPFIVYSNVLTVSTAYFIRKNLLEAWTTIEERWGGIFDADNWNISLYANMGNDNGETIIYGKNLEHISVYEDWSAVCTKIYPVGYDGVTLPENYLESQVQYDEPYTRKVEFETNLDTETATEQQYIAELRTNAQKYINENQYPKVCYEVNANVNQNLEICDTVHVKHPLCDILTEVLEYTYNIISGKTKTLSFGNYSRDVKTKFDAIKSSFTQIQQKLSKQEQVISHQTDLINNLNKNGIVYIDDNEILILDQLPKEEAENVWRFGLGGIGFSSNGYEGPFETAITMDGQINANFITTGTMSTARIEGLETALTNIRTAIELNGNNITSIIEDVTSQGNRLSRVVQTVEELNSKIQDIADITVSGESQLGQVSLINVNESEPVVIKVHPIGTNISYLYPRDNLYPSDSLFMPDRIIRFTNTSTNEIFDYELPDDLLYYDQNNYDDFLLDYESQSCIVNKKVGYNADGTTYVLSTPRTDSYSFPLIELSAGNYEVSLPGYSSAYLYVILMAANYYTTQFATNVRLNSEINQTKESIIARVSADYELKEDAISKYSELNQTAVAIQTQVNNNSQDISTLEQTAQSIETEITNARGSSSTLKQRIDSIATRVSSAEGDISTLEQTAQSIGTEITNARGNSSTLKQRIDGVNIEVGKKYNTSDFTNAKITAKINDGTSNVKISAEKIDLAGKTINLTSDNIAINSTNFKVDKNGNMTCNNGNFTGGKVILTGGTQENPNYMVKDNNSETSILPDRIYMTSVDSAVALNYKTSSQVKNKHAYLYCDNIGGGITLGGNVSNDITLRAGTNPEIRCLGAMYATAYNYLSLEKLKKNYENLDNALEIIKSIDIYRYNLKTEEDGAKKHIGLVIGDNFNYSKDVTTKDNSAVDTYSLASVCLQGIKEVLERVEQLEKMEANRNDN